MRKLLFLVTSICIFVLSSCNNTSEKKTSAADSLKKNGTDSTTKDVSIELKTNISPTAAKAITLVLEDKKKVTLDKFPPNSQDEIDRYGTDWDRVRDSSTRCLIDINNDNIPELITQYVVGNPDEFYNYSDIFTRVSENTYKRIGHYANSLSAYKNGVSLDFSSELVDFSNCYYCQLSDTFKVPVNGAKNINLELRNGAFVYAGKDDQLNEAVETNLKALKARGIPNLKKNQNLGSPDMDDGTRNAFAAYIVTYFFNNDRDMAKTKEVFSKYYDNADKNKIWKALEEYLNGKSAELNRNMKFQ